MINLYLSYKNAIESQRKGFRFMTLPNYPQIDSNITMLNNVGITTLIPFDGKDVK